jgi:hypothetical protein
MVKLLVGKPQSEAARSHLFLSQMKSNLKAARDSWTLVKPAPEARDSISFFEGNPTKGIMRRPTAANQEGSIRSL